MKKSAKAKAARKAPNPSDDAVKAKTGKTWAEWFSILDKAGARKMKHSEIGRFLYEKHKVSMWWMQTIATAYEQKHGLRETYETCAGDFSSSVSRTFDCGVGKIYSAWQDATERRSWLKGDSLEISSGQPNKTLRGAWDGNTSRIEIRFTPKGPSKTQVVVDHMKMDTSKQAIAMKTFWSENLEHLRQRVEGMK
ncbi:MAG: DUF4287 domain-containing protein [Candidatus Acidiferrales bacterium]